ncbi:MAG: hypothetical protein A2176_13155 [Spirochaetes bacterium RBG_13_51_14]|nr:MAG: hypothetical protein A2176_13155 [Spirochaetes bacterium RBG_13_51_14]
MTTDAQSARVLLVSANREEINMPVWPLGIACVAAAARQAGHDVTILDLIQHSDPLIALEKVIEECGPDVIGVSVRNIDDQCMRNTMFYLDDAKRIIAHCKKVSSAPVVLGGPGYSIFPESALRYLGADAGIPGEGEAAFPELAGLLKGGSRFTGIYPPVAKTAEMRPIVKNLDRFPLPEPSLIPTEAYAGSDFLMPVQTRRGCPFACSYCSTPVIEGRTVRSRSPEMVVSWLSDCVRSGIKKFYFVDNTFNLPESYALELCEAMIRARLNISWRCILYPCRLKKKLVEAMALAGCTEVSLGAESGSEQMLAALNKEFSPGDFRHAADLLARYRMRRNGFLLLGGPGETMQTVEESLRFADSLDLDALKITIGIRIYPNTELALLAARDCLIAPDEDLLRPRFYMAQGLEPGLSELVNTWKANRPNWIV